jgi:hypothetical protein
MELILRRPIIRLRKACFLAIDEAYIWHKQGPSQHNKIIMLISLL